MPQGFAASSFTLTASAETARANAAGDHIHIQSLHDRSFDRSFPRHRAPYLQWQAVLLFLPKKPENASDKSIEMERRKKIARKRLAAEQIVTKPRQIEVLQGPEKTIAVACKEAETTKPNNYRWRNEYGGLGVTRVEGCLPRSDLRL